MAENAFPISQGIELGAIRVFPVVDSILTAIKADVSITIVSIYVKSYERMHLQRRWILVFCV